MLHISLFVEAGKVTVSVKNGKTLIQKFSKAIGNAEDDEWFMSVGEFASDNPV